MCENLVWIGICDARFQTRMSHSNQKSCVKIWFGLVEIGGMLIFSGGRSPLLGGLHVTCNAHFRTWLSYSSQKSCVVIWFGLVEIGGTWIFRGAEAPIRGGYMWPGKHIFELGRAIPVKSLARKFGSDWFSLSRVKAVTNIQISKRKKKKSQTRLKTIFLEKFFSSE